MSTYYGKNGELRMYDGTPSTPNFILVRFSEMNIQVPEGHDRPEEILRLNRGKLDANAHYVQGLDDPIVGPLTFTTSFLLESGANKDLMHEFIGTLFANGQDATWNCGSGNTALTTAKGTSTGLVPGLTSTLVTLPLFTDSRKVCVNVEVLWDDLTGSKMGRRLTEVYFPPAQQALNEAPDRVTINLSGQVYGPILHMTAFTAGNWIQG